MRRGISGGVGRRGAFRQAVAKPTVLGPEYNPWWWNPSNVYAQMAPDWFLRKLKDIGAELSCTWNPITERWQVWSRAPKIQHKVCQGWRLLFVHNGPNGEHLPLDERLFARLYAASVLEHGSAKAYFDRIQEEYRRDREKADRQSTQDQVDMAMPYWEHSQIKVSMCGKSSGSKFSTYHA